MHRTDQILFIYQFILIWILVLILLYFMSVSQPKGLPLQRVNKMLIIKLFGCKVGISYSITMIVKIWFTNAVVRLLEECCHDKYFVSVFFKNL